MRSQDVDGHARPELREVIGTDHEVVVLGQHVVQARLVLDEVVDARPVEQRPFHVRQQPGERIAGRRARLEHLFDQRQHRILVEALPAEVRVLPRPHLQLPGADGPLDVDAAVREPLQVRVPEVGVDDVEPLLPPVEPVPDEGAEHPVLLVDAVEERADVTLRAERAAGELDGTVAGSHGYLPAEPREMGTVNVYVPGGASGARAGAGRPSPRRAGPGRRTACEGTRRRRPAGIARGPRRRRERSG